MSDNAYEKFGEWLKRQPYWVQDATWRIYNNKEVDDQAIEDYVLMCQRQVRGEQFNFKQLRETDIQPVSCKTNISISRVSDIKNVNALAENTNLTFGEKGVSVVYGLNGAGKSGFMRIFKHVCGNPYAEPIQHNVYKDGGNGKATCSFKLVNNGIEETVVCDLGMESKDKRLQQCDVFDTRISGAYISSSNSVSYEPFVFQVLTELAEIAGRIEKRIKFKLDNLSTREFEIPNDFKDLDAVKWISCLSGNATIPEDCKEWTTTDENKKNVLKELFESKDDESKLKILEHNRNNIKDILNDILGINDSISGENGRKCLKAYAVLKDAKRQFELTKKLFLENAQEQDRVSVSVGEWKQLWQLGRSYYESYLIDKERIPFATQGSICPMCLQPLVDDTLKRFASVDEYVNGKSSDLLKTAHKSFTDLVEKTLYHRFTEEGVRAKLQGVIDEDSFKDVLGFYSDLRLFGLSENEDKAVEYIKCGDVKNVYDRLKSKLDEVESEIKGISELREQTTLDKRKVELKTLEYRYWVNLHLNDVQDAINRLKTKSELEDAKRYIRTNSITLKSNELADELITEEFINRFNSELSRLAKNLRVKLEKEKSVKGKSPYRVVLDTTDKARKSPQDILSEGEQRIVSLAAFFADAAGRNERTPIIIDDPISSLDYHYEEAATKRITELARERQVIIFTHRISLLVGLSEQCDKVGVDFTERHIRGTMSGKGVVDFEDIYHGNIVKQLKGIKDRISEIKNMDVDSREYIDSCSRIFTQMRICIERSLEDVFFQNMVKRFSRRIMTGKILKMDRISKEDCKIIDSMMTKYSFAEHSQPEDSAAININLDDTLTDIDKFVKWIKEYNNKINDN